MPATTIDERESKVMAMSNLLGQLENNEAILLMYLAGELPDEDRAEVEQMLASDAGLRALLAELAALQSDVTGAFATADTAMLLPRREAAVRRVSRAMVAAQVAPAPPAAALEPLSKRLRLAWWAYPIAAAAALVVAVVVLNDKPHVKLAGTQKDDGPAYVDPATNQNAYAMAEAFADPQSVSNLEGMNRSLLALHTPDENLLIQLPE